MTWTKEDTERLRNKGKEMPAMFFLYAASHIEALEARVAELEGPCSFCLETPGHGASKPICDGCAQLATDQAKTSRDLVERIAALKAERARVAELEANAKWSFDLVVKRLGGDRVLWPKFSDLVVGASDRIATLEAERANSIPRDVLVRALERNGCDCECEHHYSEHDADCQRCLACRLAAAIESGAWPGEGGVMPMPRRESRPCSGSACPDPGLGRECHCRAKRGFKFASDDWCSCACHRNYPWYYREGEWCLDESEDADAAVVIYAHLPSPETGHIGWVWWALGKMGEAASLDEAKRKAVEALTKFEESGL